MPDWLFIALSAGAGFLIRDRLLLMAEAKGWIDYRRNGLSRGGASCHTLQLASIFNPGMQAVFDAKYEDEEQEDESRAPPVPDDDDAS